MEHLSITEAAKSLNCSRQYIWSLIKMNRLKARKIGNTYIVYEKDVKNVKLTKEA